MDHLIKEMGRKSFSKFASLQIFVFFLQSSCIGKSSGRQINSYSTGTNGWLVVEIKISNMQTCETQKDLLRKFKRRLGPPEYRDVLHQLRKSHLGGLWSGCCSLRICLDIEHLRWTFIEMSTLHYCPVKPASPCWGMVCQTQRSSLVGNSLASASEADDGYEDVGQTPNVACNIGIMIIKVFKCKNIFQGWVKM